MVKLAILGAGPVGLEMALAAGDAGIPFTLYEAAPAVGHHVRAWGHVALFTPWAMNVSARMARHLARAGLEPPGGESCPTGHQLAEALLEPLARLEEVAPHLRLATRVDAVGRAGVLKHEEIGDPSRKGRRFRLVLSATSEPGAECAEAATAVVDCTGTYGQPNWTGEGGIPAPGERAAADRIARHLPDLGRGAPGAAEWEGKSVLLVGAGASAQTAAAALADLAERAPGTRVTWLVRSPAPGWGAVPNDPLPGRAGLAARAAELAAGASPAVRVLLGATVERISPNGERLTVTLCGAGGEQLEVDRVLSLTGYVGDDRLYRQLQVHECYATAAPMALSAALLAGSGANCLDQVSHGVDALRSAEPDFFVLGAKSYGRNPQFLLRVGYEQVDEVIGALAS